MSEVINITFKDGCEYRFSEANLQALIGANVQDVLVYDWSNLDNGLFVYARAYEPYEESIEDSLYRSAEDEQMQIFGKPCICRNVGYWQILTAEDLEETHGGVLSISYEGKVKVERIDGVLFCTTSLYSLINQYLNNKEDSLLEMIWNVALIVRSEVMKDMKFERLLESGSDESDVERQVMLEVSNRMNVPLAVLEHSREHSVEQGNITVITPYETQNFCDYESAAAYLLHQATSPNDSDSGDEIETDDEFDLQDGDIESTYADEGGWGDWT